MQTCCEFHGFHGIEGCRSGKDCPERYHWRDLPITKEDEPIPSPESMGLVTLALCGAIAIMAFCIVGALIAAGTL